MKINLVAVLLGLVFGISFIDHVSSVGSKTYETNNGFPINFLGDLVNSVKYTKFQLALVFQQQSFTGLYRLCL